MDDKSIRLSGTSYAVLALLDQLGEATPYDLKQALAQSIENFWPVPHTTFYAEPTRLAAAGYLSERKEQHGRRRKLYALTDAGRAALAAWAASATAGHPQTRDETLLKIFAGSEPEPLLHARRAWHVDKQAELEAMLAEDPWDLEEGGGPRRTLLIGIRYHAMSIELLDEFLLALPAAGAEPCADG
ncbi:PadR family transcriptional regulator [Conexibacter sp. CPCC 206217]|uniref:PadR family transcriptional regulator n=1 Tax=Conexibacter sp. CPCC 206217 TaxID=3064574 RepID=UPI002727B7F2|nr:helix-turn-helix transcriptional regulator [Conexibacter sp. CPCC 206217]MDO8211963.1 helix-turn-helix transcriptional regulator [Conexibacter sp. CPCC 206217]